MRPFGPATIASLVVTCLCLAGPAEAGCPGDCSLPSNGAVDFADLLKLLGDWGTSDPCSDLNGDTVVDFADVLALIGLWGPCPVQLTGACCNPLDGACFVLPEADCMTSGGVFAGGGTDCGDTDGDRIPDAFELDDCTVAQSPCFYGTSPFDADTDDDGLDDGDEAYGTLDGLDLPAMGVDPCRKDLLLETDWVHTSGQATNRNKPHPGQVNRLVSAFAASPTPNPDGSTGITLHIDTGQAPYGGGNAALDPANDTRVDVDSFGFDSGEYFDIKAANFAANRHGYFHYCLMCDSYSIAGAYFNSSGLGELPGDDLIVSMGQWATGNDNRIGNILMHELGHNLVLHHGGFENRNYKPNYNSVMNYAFAFCGTDGDDDALPDDLADYSRGTNIPLSENALVEADGVTGMGPPIDWSGNGDATEIVSRNVNCPPTNGFGCFGQLRTHEACGTAGSCGDGICSTLHDHADWLQLELDHLDDEDSIVEIIHCVPGRAVVHERR